MCHWCPRLHPMGLVPRSTEYMSYVIYMCMWKDDQDAGCHKCFSLCRQSQREREPGIGVAGSFDSEALAVALFESSRYDHFFPAHLLWAVGKVKHIVWDQIDVRVVRDGHHFDHHDRHNLIMEQCSWMTDGRFQFKSKHVKGSKVQALPSFSFGAV